jgi:YegS/Rv2252/BmrU family lipid kinase
MPRRAKLIFNPHAHRGSAWAIGPQIQSIVARHGEAEWSATEYPTQASQLAEQAAAEGFDTVVAIGGDGTVHEVVNGLMRIPAERRPLLGIVPVGSGNDFAASIPIKTDVEEAMHRVFHAEPRAVDLGVLRDNTGRVEYWDNAVGIGFDATVTIRTYRISRIKGFAMYLWAVIQTIILNHDAPLMTVQTDSESFESEALMLVMCNGPREGGGFMVAPNARPDDGVFEYAMIEHVSRPMMFRLIPEVMNGTHGKFRQVRMGTFHRMSVTLAHPIPIHADGEIFAGFTSDITHLEMEILPGALQLIA